LLNPPFDSFRIVWIEISTSRHGHGGIGWEFGTCLWSPSTDKAGRDKYAIMREPAPGYLILNLYEDTWDNDVMDRRLCGSSIVRTSYREVSKSPPLPGNWANMAPYVRIDLEGYEKLKNPVSFATI